jgi:hypothetical protein
MSTYNVHLIVGQRICSYPGEYAPEVIASADEFANDDNPDYLADERKKAEASAEYIAIAEIVVQVPFEAIEKVLSKAPPIIEGTVKP